MRRLPTRFAWLLMVVSIAAPEARAEGYTSEPAAVVRSRVQSRMAFLIDVREPAEWNQGHLRGAFLLPLSVLQVWERDGINPDEADHLYARVPKGSVVYCHCAAGGRTPPAADILRSLGYDARPLRQGYRELLELGFEPESNPDRGR